MIQSKLLSRSGRPMPPLKLAKDFFHYVTFEPNTSCWLWSGASCHLGYGRRNINGSLKLTHRISYEMHMGQIPNGLVLDHLCRTPACCNPKHLEPVTPRENLRRGMGGANNFKKYDIEYPEAK